MQLPESSAWKHMKGALPNSWRKLFPWLCKASEITLKWKLWEVYLYLQVYDATFFSRIWILEYFGFAKGPNSSKISRLDLKKECFWKQWLNLCIVNWFFCNLLLNICCSSSLHKKDTLASANSSSFENVLTVWIHQDLAPKRTLSKKEGPQLI